MGAQENAHEVAGPVVALGDEPVIFFRSAKVAEGWMEPIDVENGEYSAVYDGHGRRLGLEVVAETQTHLFGLLSLNSETVRIYVDPDGPVEATRLRAILVEFLDRTKLRGRYPPDASLEELVDLGASELGI